MAEELTVAAARIEIPAAFFSFDEPIIEVRNGKGYPTETFLRLLESLFLRTGGEVDQIKEVADSNEVVKEAAENLVEGQVALDAAVTAAQDAGDAAANSASQTASDLVATNNNVAAVNDTVTTLNTVTIPALDTRVTALETP